MKPGNSQSGPRDGVGWTIFAIGVIAIFAVYFYSLAFAGHGDSVAELLYRAGVRSVILFAAGGLAIAGPLTVTIGQLIIARSKRPRGKKPEAIGFGEL